MRRRCEVCGARLGDDGACPDCDLDLLAVADVDAGIRREDRYVALPPGPRWVPRRVRRESSRAPIVIVGIVLTVLVLAGVLGQGEPTRAVPATPPLLEEPTGVTLLRAGPRGLERIDIDKGRVLTFRTTGAPVGRVRQLVTVPDGIVALTGPGAFMLDDRSATWLGNADALVPSPEGAQLVSYLRPGEIVLTPPGVVLELEGDTDQEIVGEVVAVLSSGPLLQRVRDDGVPLLEIYGEAGAHLLAADETFVAAALDTIVTRPRCPDTSLSLIHI